jgi:hypothetical protein
MIKEIELIDISMDKKLYSGFRALKKEYNLPYQ